MRHLLLKYVSCPQYAEDFMNGILYMNTLNYFWNEFKLGSADSVPGQMDLYEGIYGTVNSAGMEALGIPKDFQGHNLTDISLRAEGYRYCNVHCYYRLDYWFEENGISWNTSEAMKDFGEYVVIIDDERAFLNLLHGAATREGYDYLCGSVHYRPPKKDGEIITVGHNIVVRSEEQLVNVTEFTPGLSLSARRDSFDKMDGLSYQKEWRISLYRGVKETAGYALHLDSDLKGVAHVVKSKDLDGELERMFRSGRLLEGLDTAWYGNIGRRELREKFYALGDYQTTMLGMIG